MTLTRYLIENNVLLAITEQGLGVPVTNEILSIDGASKCLAFSECPYAKEFQNSSFRSVSKEAVIYKSQENYNRLVNTYKDNRLFVGVAISGAYYDRKEKNISHFWIAYTFKNNKNKVVTGYIHYTDRDREPRLSLFLEIPWIFSGCLGNMLSIPYTSLNIPINIDTIYVPDHGDVYYNRILEKFGIIAFDKEGNPDRVLDYLRRGVFFRGSFNPPTKAHLDIMKHTDAIPEISILNKDKGSIGLTQMLHRVKMINSLGYPCLVSNVGSFADFTDIIRKTYTGSIDYVVGTDTYCRVLRDKESTSNWDSLKDVCFRVMGDRDIRSSYFRETKNTELIPESVYNYIVNNKLYGF